MEMCGLCPSSSVGGFLIILLSIFTSEYLSGLPLSAATNGEWNADKYKMIASDTATHLAQPIANIVSKMHPTVMVWNPIRNIKLKINTLRITLNLSALSLPHCTYMY
eukprot:m.220878 g.220878  ORF g.220878 m.220878 type:complete len:107 (+) comp33332_c0_seq3:1478-1798(+)